MENLIDKNLSRVVSLTAEDGISLAVLGHGDHHRSRAALTVAVARAELDCINATGLAFIVRFAQPGATAEQPAGRVQSYWSHRY